MFGKRRAANAKARRHEELADRWAQEIPLTLPPDERFPRNENLPAQNERTLDTMCTCGHTRRDHTGMRMDVDGRCLECDCAEFREASETPELHGEMMQRMRAAIAQVDRMQEICGRLRAAGYPGGTSDGPPRPADRSGFSDPDDAHGIPGHSRPRRTRS
jgi:hypothetical protein